MNLIIDRRLRLSLVANLDRMYCNESHSKSDYSYCHAKLEIIKYLNLQN